MPPAVLVIGHGTKSLAGQADLGKIVDSLRNSFQDRKVGYGYLELAQPDIETGLRDLIDEHVHQVTVVPLVLFGAGHAKSDIAGAVEMARVSYPSVKFAYSDHLGVTPELLEALFNGALGQARALTESSAASDAGVLMVGRGATDPDANSDLFKAGRLLQEFYSIPLLECCFVSLARPSVTEGLERLYVLGARQIVVLPYFLFPGALPDRISDQARQWGATRPDIDVQVVSTLGAHPVLVELMHRQIARAEEGLVHMSCDLCVYRKRIPGYEDRQGRPISVAFPPHHTH